MKKSKSTSQKLNVWIHGATGRMGREIQKSILNQPDRFAISGGSSRTFEGEPFYQGQPVTAEKLQHALEKTDVLLDFSTAEGHEVLRKAFAKDFDKRLSILIGTTGLSKDQRQFWKKCAEKKNLSILFAPNTSLGVLAMNKAAKFIAQTLRTSPFEILLLETHHNQKKDAPSGTAKLIADSIDYPHDEIVSIRAGGVVGEHELRFIGLNEEVTLKHRAFSRALFAEGALVLARWLANQEAGIYTLEDVEL